MLAVRYAALAALVVWLGGMAALELLDPVLGGDSLRRFQLVAYACGATMLICLFILKFVGPPPHGFLPRTALVSVMLGLQLYADFLEPTSAAPMAIAMLFGFGQLFWYVRE